MKYYEIELENETIKLRLTSSDCIEIEKKTGRSLLDLIDDYSIGTITTLLKYMRRSEIPQFSDKDACSLYDKFIDNGYTMEQILLEVIYEGLCVSGFFKKEQLDQMKQKIAEDNQQILK